MTPHTALIAAAAWLALFAGFTTAWVLAMVMLYRQTRNLDRRARALRSQAMARRNRELDRRGNDMLGDLAADTWKEPERKAFLAILDDDRGDGSNS